MGIVSEKKLTTIEGDSNWGALPLDININSSLLDYYNEFDATINRPYTFGVQYFWFKDSKMQKYLQVLPHTINTSCVLVNYL